MGRPVRRDVNGTEVFGTYAGAAAGIKVSSAYISGGARTDGYIQKQKGSRRYQVYSAAAGASAVLTLSATSPAASGKMVLLGWVAGSGAAANESTSGGTSKIIMKLNKRTAVDSNGVRYTWTLQNDSAADYIELTAI